MSEKTRYVLGLMFDPDARRVVLIHKKRPEWLRGRWNGPGGKVEAGETPFHAMCREFTEETGVEYDNWQLLATLETERSVIHVFRAFTHKIEEAWTQTDEKIEVHNVDFLPIHTMNNVRWLITMARYEGGGPRARTPSTGMPFVIKEAGVGDASGRMDPTTAGSFL